MSATSAATRATETNTLRPSTEQIAGAAAIVFAIGVVVSNVIVFGAPFADEEPSVAAAWYADNQSALKISTALVAVTFPALLAFAGAMVELAKGSEAGRRWMLMGAAGGAALTGCFAIVTSSHIALTILSDAGSAEGFSAAWAIYNATFAINMAVLGAAFLGFTLGAHAAGLIPGWQRVMGLAGALCLLVSGLANQSVAEGSAAASAPGLIGFLLWLAWLLIIGVRLLRR